MMVKKIHYGLFLTMISTIVYTFPNSVYATVSSFQGQRPPELDDLDDVVECTKGTPTMQNNGKEDSLRFVNDDDVDAALEASKKKSPQVYEDSLRVWKNFSGKSTPNYTYRYWARDLVAWLRQNRHLSFESAAKVGRVFKIMQEKQIISPHAAVLLTTDVWNMFIYQEGIPELDKHLDKNIPLPHKRQGEGQQMTSGLKRGEVEA